MKISYLCINSLMNMIHSFPLRFGDPATSIALNSSCMAYGTAYGKVEAFNFITNESFQIAEISEEYIGSISISPDNTLTYAIGDYYCNQIEYPYDPKKTTTQAYSRIHTLEDCSNSLTFIHEHKVCLVPTTGTNIYLLCIPDHSCKIQNPLPPHSIPLDLYNDTILIENYSSTGARQYSHFSYEKGASEVILQLDSDMHITSIKLFSSGMVFIADYAALNIYNYLSEYFEVPFESPAEIVAFNIYEENQDIWAGVVDIKGTVTILKNWKTFQTDEIKYKGSKLNDFDKGYPYVLALSPPYLTVSSDNFVHILKFSHS